jgi:TPR repeat protein
MPFATAYLYVAERPVFAVGWTAMKKTSLIVCLAALLGACSNTVEPDEDKARRYFRKAADLGSPEAQAYVGELLAPWDKAPEIARQMRRCATDQGYGEAASTLGINLKTIKLYSEAVKVFQTGLKPGTHNRHPF